jgi:hypothetical protein
MKQLPDHHFLALLSRLGVLAAARSMGSEVEASILSLTTSLDHPYRSYRWSTAVDEHGRCTIHARPPEEETGWTPWERWVLDPNGKPVRQEWVVFPARGAPAPRMLTDPENNRLSARHAGRSHKSLLHLLHDARIPDAAAVLDLDFAKVFGSLENHPAAETYRLFRWTVIPHYLGADLPVIYALPPMDRADVWPWESWYRAGDLLHHVHLTKPNKRTTGEWQEMPEAPQRPPEIFGVCWFWYDDPCMHPALATT